MTILTVEDKIAVAELIAQFAHYSDYGDWARLESLYLPEIVTELEGFPIKYEGVAAQIKHAKDSDEQTNGKNRHYNFNLFIEDSNGAAIANYSFVNANAGATPLTAQIVTSGRMRDTLIKTDTGWKISHRLVRFDQNFELDF